ncbi:MAG: type II toxin-antitoxin system VapC family toxin [Verrucomicrobiaceae bacterium]|nr:type II toxin-antitoxin system VapC family toxin [Verrucomicrobiaceae bacterium]
MKLLLDTHAMLWWWTAPERLPPKALSLMSDPSTGILASAVSAYELTYKNRLGKLQLPSSLLNQFERSVADERWTELQVSTSHSLLAGRFASDHRDPFDRLLAAQAIIEQAVLVTLDPAFESFPEVERLWA